MARLKDVPSVLKAVGKVDFAKRVWQQVGEDAVFTWGAALAYSWMFAVFPFLIFLLSLTPLLPQKVKEGFKENAQEMVNQVLVGDAATTVTNTINNVLDHQGTGGILSIGLLITIWAASGGMAMTMSALDKAYDIEVSRPYIKQRLIAMALTIVSASLIILVMVLLPVGTAVLTWLSKQGTVLGWVKILINLIRYPLAIAMLLAILAMIYHFGPTFKHKFQAVTPGALFCIVVWLLLGLAFRLYLTRFGGAESYTKTYGAVAGAAILLLFFYIDALVLLIGAEINSEIDFAVLGLGASPAVGKAAAPLPAANEPEQKELAKELASRGSAGSNASKPAALNPPATAHPVLVRSSGDSSMLKTILMAITGISLIIAWRAKRQTPAKLIEDSKARAERMRVMYPMTHALIDKSDGNGNLH